ncbi:MAG: UDP-glucose:undecaprenyl-phosphate glucose-1-phosphate transferase [Firmicutes bacterium ADurb.Bin456]|nr:MAG: UDP-glucose:undecaprenyl-phosphate glucose-1-phosphate transferase [Firmicutes bacterium ADurb.Bin456]
MVNPCNKHKFNLTLSMIYSGQLRKNNSFLPSFRIYLIALLIKLDSRGPVFFVQKRLGRNGRVFNCYKLRTMVCDAEEVLGASLAKDSILKKEWEANFKLKNDPRVTRAGRFLRTTSLDELSQVINVIRGDMSLVGPRPRPLYELEVRKEDVTFQLGLAMRPGITGLWQVSGRNELDFEQRINLDAAYVRNWTLWLDISIAVKTIGIVLRQRGAY